MHDGCKAANGLDTPVDPEEESERKRNELECFNEIREVVIKLYL